jgi:hypothetical protein
LLNDAVNKLERGDVVLMKTLVGLNYNERMETKQRYEETYESVRKCFLSILWIKSPTLIKVFKFDLFEKGSQKRLSESDGQAVRTIN